MRHASSKQKSPEVTFPKANLFLPTSVLASVLALLSPPQRTEEAEQASEQANQESLATQGRVVACLKKTRREKGLFGGIETPDDP